MFLPCLLTYFAYAVHYVFFWLFSGYMLFSVPLQLLPLCYLEETTQSFCGHHVAAASDAF